MTTMVAHPRLINRPPALSDEELAGIAETFDQAPQAVWVHDLSGRCVYRNPTACGTAPCTGQDSMHDILDHQDRRIGLLRLRVA